MAHTGDIAEGICGEQVHLILLGLGFLQEKAHLDHLMLGSPQNALPTHLTLQYTLFSMPCTCTDAAALANL